MIDQVLKTHNRYSTPPLINSPILKARSSGKGDAIDDSQSLSVGKRISRLLRRLGQKPASETACPFWFDRNDASRPVARTCTITSQPQDAKALLVAKVLDYTADGIIVTDGELRILFVNPAFSAITGYACGDVCDKSLTMITRRANDLRFLRKIRDEVMEHGRWQGELWQCRCDGEQYLARLSVTSLLNADGRLINYIVVFSDITRLWQSAERISFLEHHDSTTGLANREKFLAHLRASVERASFSGCLLAVVLLDLSRYRLINAWLGNQCGDKLLRLVGRDLSKSIRTSDTLARINGDEFGIIIDQAESVSEITEIVNDLLLNCRQPKTICSRTIAMDASIGIAVSPLDGIISGSLLRYAAVALKQAKRQGPGTIHFFQVGMVTEVERRLDIEASLCNAIEANELTLHYQPQVRLADGLLVGVEALLRWESPQLGRVSPAEFIPVAEETGLIHDLGLWVLEHCCKQLVLWSRFSQLRHIALNVSILQIESGDLPQQITRLLERTGIDPSRLEIEVTESRLMQQAEQSITQLRQLRNLGIRIAIDDFGTGYSSLALLRHLPLHQLKLDKSFVDDILTDINCQAIARAVIALGKSLGLDVLAEGVEHAQQSNWLLNAGCDCAQGYYYDRPLPADLFVAHWLEARSPIRLEPCADRMPTG